MRISDWSADVCSSDLPLAAWIILSGDVEQLEPVRAAVRALVEAIVGQSTDEAAPDRVRAAVLMMAVTAFGDAVIGPHVRALLDQPDDAMLDLIARPLPLFLIPTGIQPAAPSAAEVLFAARPATLVVGLRHPAPHPDPFPPFSQPAHT